MTRDQRQEWEEARQIRRQVLDQLIYQLKERLDALGPEDDRYLGKKIGLNWAINDAMDLK